MSAFRRLGDVTSRCVSSEVGMPFVHYHEGVEYERALWDLTPSYTRRDVSDVCLPLVLVCPPFHLFT